MCQCAPHTLAELTVFRTRVQCSGRKWRVPALSVQAASQTSLRVWVIGGSRGVFLTAGLAALLRGLALPPLGGTLLNTRPPGLACPGPDVQIPQPGGRMRFALIHQYFVALRTISICLVGSIRQCVTERLALSFVSSACFWEWEWQVESLVSVVSTQVSPERASPQDAPTPVLCVCLLRASTFHLREQERPLCRPRAEGQGHKCAHLQGHVHAPMITKKGPLFTRPGRGDRQKQCGQKSKTALQTQETVPKQKQSLAAQLSTRPCPG